MAILASTMAGYYGIKAVIDEQNNKLKEDWWNCLNDCLCKVCFLQTGVFVCCYCSCIVFSSHPNGYGFNYSTTTSTHSESHTRCRWRAPRGCGNCCRCCP
jgi:hypothetical protein